MVRRPRHHEVVGRPLAQRVLRRVGLLLVRGRGHRVHRRVDRLRQRPQADRLPRRPAALDPPDRGRQRRPARGRGQLRHDHLRQGRLGAQAARRLGRPGRLRRRHPRSTSRTTRSATPSSPTCSPPWRSRRVASWRAGPRSGCRPPASTPSHPSSSSMPTAATPRSPSRRPRTRTGRRCVATASASACTTTSDGHLVRREYLEVDVEGATTDVAELVGKPQPALLLLNDEDHAYAKIRLDERSLATVISGLSTARGLAGPRPRLGRRVGHDPRRRDARPDWVRLVLANIGAETDAWGVTRIPASTALAVNRYSDPAHRAELHAQWERGCASCCWTPSPAATTSSPSPAPTPAPPAATPPWTTSSACSTAPSPSRAWPSTRTCAGS